MVQQRSMLRLFALITLAFLPQQSTRAAEVYQVLTDASGRQIEAQILGFSQGQGARVDTVKNLTANHFVYLRVKGNNELFKVKFDIFSKQSQGLLEKLNRLTGEDRFWNSLAVETARTLLDSYNNLQENGTDPALIEKSLSEFYSKLDSKTKKQPLVCYAWALVQIKLGNKANATLDSVIRAQPDYWPAWRTLVCMKLVEVNAMSAAGKLKEFHRQVLADLNGATENDTIDPGTVQNLFWIKKTSNVLSTNDDAKKIIRGLEDDPQAAVYLERYEKQIAVDNARVEKELQQRDAEDRERIDMLIVVANREYQNGWIPLLNEYNATEADYNKKYPEYRRLDSQASILRSSANAAERRADAQSRLVTNLRSRRSDEDDDDIKSDLDDQIRDGEEVLRELRSAASAADSAASSAESAAASYYNSVLAPLKAKMHRLYQQGLVFHRQFRAKHAEAIANDAGLKMIFDKWDAWVLQIQKQRLGVSRSNTINRKAKKEKLKAKQKQEALELLSLIRFSVDEAIQTLSQELTARDIAPTP